MNKFRGDLEFNKLLAGSGSIDMARLLLEFAADAYRDLDEPGCLALLDDWTEQVLKRLEQLPADADLRSRLACLASVLHGQQRLRGNDENYYDARNSYLNDVLERRTGLPILLSLVYVIIGQRAGLPVFGVGTPGHFVVGAQEDGRRLYLDPFTDGAVLSQAECRRRVEARLGRRGGVGDEYFRPARPLEIVSRLLRNLKTAHVASDQWDEALTVQQRLALLLPEVSQEQRDLGLIYLRTSHPAEALRLLEPYAACCSMSEAESLQPFMQTARRLLAELN